MNLKKYSNQYWFHFQVLSHFTQALVTDGIPKRGKSKQILQLGHRNAEERQGEKINSSWVLFNESCD